MTGNIWHTYFGWLTWTAAGVLIALALGLFNLVEPRVMRRREQRRSVIEVRFERYWPRGGTAHFRLIAINHGPATAHRVQVQAMTEKQGDWTIDATVKVLLPGQEFHYPLSFDRFGAEKWFHAQVTWTDGAGQHTDETPRLISRQDRV